MPTIISKLIIGGVSAVIIWMLYFGVIRLTSYLKQRNNKSISLEPPEEIKIKSFRIHRILFSASLILTGIIIGIGVTILYDKIISNKSNRQSDNIEQLYKTPSKWKSIHKVDVFGDKTNDVCLVYDFTLKLPSGIRGGSLPATFIIDDVKGHTSYSIVISPNAANKPEEDYGLFLKLWYKEEGGSQSKSMLKFHFQKGVGYVPNLMSYGKINDWKSKHKKVRFKGFTTDTETAQEFENTPNGIGRKEADVFLNPEFTIQF